MSEFLYAVVLRKKQAPSKATGQTRKIARRFKKGSSVVF